ncbi:hypothetical protein GWI33_001783 [Rhynchophorus ferrugineus]|uniref:Uncharacterized protein n=1 Tax=Rhynchophorus ferrugineus TaxID=354439 RepID=A0A834MG65_RHYFE|nr:hypothetical protein GWI33_001783 [Rhynchophorus ferrugineus]
MSTAEKKRLSCLEVRSFAGIMRKDIKILLPWNMRTERGGDKNARHRLLFHCFFGFGWRFCVSRNGTAAVATASRLPPPHPPLVQLNNGKNRMHHID